MFMFIYLFTMCGALYYFYFFMLVFFFFVLFFAWFAELVKPKKNNNNNKRGCLIAVFMSEDNFSLLSRLGVSVPAASMQEAQTTGTFEEHYRVVSPCRRPPFRGRTVGGEPPSVHSAPVAPLADYFGEVMTVKDRNSHADVEYLIYNARVPSIRAVNMQLMEEKKKRQAEERARRMSPDSGFFRHNGSDYDSRRRILEHLQNVNKEHAQRKVEELARERRRRLEREAADLRTAAEQLAKERAVAAAKKKSERDSLHQASLEVIERKRRVTADASSSSKTVPFDHAAFSWSEDATRSASTRRARSVAVMEANRELAERAKRERKQRRAEERIRERAVLDEARAQMENENRCAREQKQRLQEQQRSASAETYRKPLNTSTGQADSSGLGWFPQVLSDDEGKKRKNCQRLMEENRRLHEDMKKRRAKDAELQLQHERNIIRQDQLACEKDKRNAIEAKRRQQDMLRKAAADAELQRSARKEVPSHRESFCNSITDRRSRSALEVRERQRSYYEGLKKDIETLRNARLKAKEKELAFERRLLEMNEAETGRIALKAQEKALQRRKEYARALEEQLQSSKMREERKTPTPRRSTERRVLYRCPVTSDLLSPEQFGVPSYRIQRPRWLA